MQRLLDSSPKNGVCVVEFSAKWCAGCKKFAPTFERLAKELGFEAARVDVDAAPGLSDAYGASTAALCALPRRV